MRRIPPPRGVISAAPLQCARKQLGYGGPGRPPPHAQIGRPGGLLVLFAQTKSTCRGCFYPKESPEITPPSHTQEEKPHPFRPPKSHFAPTQSGFHDGPFHPHRASYPLPLLNRTNKNKRRQLVALPGGVVRHGVLDFLVREREIIALAQLVLLNVVGIHQHHRNAGFLFQGVA